MTCTRSASPTKRHASPLVHASDWPVDVEATPITTAPERSQSWQTHACDLFGTLSVAVHTVSLFTQLA